jgi:hypothetical protein
MSIVDYNRILSIYIHILPWKARRLRVRAPHLDVENQAGHRDHDSGLSMVNE